MISLEKTQFVLAIFFIGLLFVSQVYAGGGPLGIDHRVAEDNNGVWKRSNQTASLGVVALTDVAGALWEGGETRLGKTTRQSVDSFVFAGVSTSVMKVVFSRERPSQTDDPNKFFQGGSNRSFPSGEVGFMSAAVTPFVLEYGQEMPGVYALEILPVYDAIARVKVRAHWQSDVLVGYAVGTGAGYYAHSREQPVVLGVLPHGVTVGLHKSW